MLDYSHDTALVNYWPTAAHQGNRTMWASFWELIFGLVLSEEDLPKKG